MKTDRPASEWICRVCGYPKDDHDPTVFAHSFDPPPEPAKPPLAVGWCPVCDHRLHDHGECTSGPTGDECQCAARGTPTQPEGEAKVNESVKWLREWCQRTPHGPTITCGPCRAADELERLEREVLEQCRLNGMGGEREAKLIAERDRLAAELALNKGYIGQFEAEMVRLWKEYGDKEVNGNVLMMLTYFERHYLAKLTAARAHVALLVEALEDTIEGMEDMIVYVPAYFREKWDHDGYLQRAREALKAMGTEGEK